MKKPATAGFFVFAKSPSFSFGRKKKKQKESRTGQANNSAAYTKCAQTAGAFCGKYSAKPQNDHVLQEKEKSRKKAERGRQTTLPHTQNAPKPRARFAANIQQNRKMTMCFKRKKKKQKENRTEQANNSAAYTKRAQTAGAFCGKYSAKPQNDRALREKEKEAKRKPNGAGKQLCRIHKTRPNRGRVFTSKN